MSVDIYNYMLAPPLPVAAGGGQPPTAREAAQGARARSRRSTGGRSAPGGRPEDDGCQSVGHAVPLLHLACLLLRRGLASVVTFLTTPRDAPFIHADVPSTAAIIKHGGRLGLRRGPVGV
jgi:hypothetical protein